MDTVGLPVENKIVFKAFVNESQKPFDANVRVMRLNRSE